MLREYAITKRCGGGERELARAGGGGAGGRASRRLLTLESGRTAAAAAVAARHCLLRGLARLVARIIVHIVVHVIIDAGALVVVECLVGAVVPAEDREGDGSPLCEKAKINCTWKWGITRSRTKWNGGGGGHLSIPSSRSSPSSSLFGSSGPSASSPSASSISSSSDSGGSSDSGPCDCDCGRPCQAAEQRHPQPPDQLTDAYGGQGQAYRKRG